jgi:hypothetical protein
VGSDSGEPCFQPISRLSERTNTGTIDISEQVNSQLNQCALECKYSSKNTITKDFKNINDPITFPIFVIRRNYIPERLVSILDTGANHSAINKDVVKKLNLPILFILNDNIKHNKLAITKHSRKLEAIERTNNYDSSISINSMTSFGIGI